MSTKKDKFTSEDHYYMNHAINLAAEKVNKKQIYQICLKIKNEKNS